MQNPGGAVGDTLDQIDTPALILELDAFERNIDKMARFGRTTGVGLRPHAKTHKCPVIAMKQIEAGAIGQCVQTVGEAESMVQGGVKDILVSNQVVGTSKLVRLAELAKHAKIALCFDAPQQIEAASLAAASAGVELGGLVEIDVGMGRCGATPGAQARDLALLISTARNQNFLGLQAYNGKAQHLPTYGERETATRNAVNAVQETLDCLSAVGLGCQRICGSGTGTFRLDSATGLYSELQVGSYIFMDGEYANIMGRNGQRYDEFEHSLFVLATIISRPSPDRAIVNAGLKSYSVEKGLPTVFGRSDLLLTGASDEHGTIRIMPDAEPLSIGDKLLLVPGHCDPTVNLSDWYMAIRNNRVEEIWEITARGASR